MITGGTCKHVVSVLFRINGLILDNNHIVIHGEHFVFLRKRGCNCIKQFFPFNRFK